MEVITIESSAFKKLMENVEELKQIVRDNFENKTNTNKTWLNKHEVCKKLMISDRTLQTYRDKGIIPYSRIHGKIYYKAEDIQAYFDDHYTKSVRQ